MGDKMKEKIAILDLNFMTYSYHSTPQASMYVMLISGWHKAKGDSVSFADAYPDTKMYDKVYIVKDRLGLEHISSWLIPHNVFPVGNYWDKEGIESFYDEDWETTPPDNTIYWNWLDRWTTRYPKYNKIRLAHFYLEPVKIRQKGKNYWPSGADYLILDNDMEEWDPEFLEMLDQPISRVRFAYPIPLDGRWDAVLKFIKYGPCLRTDLWLEMDYENYPTEEDYQAAADIWVKYSLGRMLKLRLNVKCNSHEEWSEAIPKIYKGLAIFRLTGKKRLRVQPYNIETFNHPRILMELKRWTGRTQGYAKNSLFDYILFDGTRDMTRVEKFLTDPYEYTNNGRFGTNKFKEVLRFIEAEPELFYVITESYNVSGY